MPNFLRKALNYLDAQTKWMLAGKPVVSDEVHAFRRSQCNGCDKRDVEKDSCTVCGCALHDSLLGNMLIMATEQCPLPEPKWLSVSLAHEEALVDEPIPSWRQVCTWIDHNGKPTYIDGLTLHMDDIVVQDVWVERHEQNGQGFSRKWDRLGDIVSVDFTGKIEVVVDFNFWRSGLTGEIKVESKKGFVRFEGGRPVECQ